MAGLKLLTTLSALAFLSTALGACLDMGQSLDAPQPAWFSGYLYSFSESGKYSVKSSGSGPEGGGSRNQEEKFGPVPVVYEVLNTTLRGAGNEPAFVVAFARGEAKEEKVSVDAGNGQRIEVDVPAQNIVLAAVRQRDLQDLPVSWDLDESCVNRVCRLVLERITIGTGPQWTFLDFPLKSGKEWSGAVSDDMTDIDGVKMRVEAEVDGKAKAKTALGSLNTIRVNFEFKPEDLEATKQEIRREAEAEGVQIRDLDLRISVKTRVFYSPVYQNVVRVERDYDQSFRVSGREDGEDFSFAFENNVDYVRELTGARLVAYPERDLGGIGRVLLGDAPLGNPNGQSFKPVGYSVQIEAAQQKVNVAAAESATYKAVLKGVQSLPEGHSASWTVIDPFGKSSAPVEGMAFEFKPEAPGQYLIEVQTSDSNGNMTSAAAKPLAANYVASAPATCAAVQLPLPTMGGCEQMKVPVRPGIVSLKVTARVSGTLSALGAGELRLTDAAGHVTRSTSRAGNAYTIQMGGEQPFNLRGVSDKDWSLAYVPSRSVMESVQYSVELLFGEDVPQVPVKSASLEQVVLGLSAASPLEGGRLASVSGFH